MWTQPEDPLGMLWLSALVAVLPVATFLVLLVVFKMQGIVAAAISVVVEVVVALWAFGMPASAVAGAGLYGVLNALWPIAYIIVMAVWLYRLAVASGHFEVVQASISGISPDQRIQVLLIAFAFGAFLEGAAGFGVPIAICAALLVQLGFRPVKAAMICLVANVAAGAYGAIGKVISPQSIAIAAGAVGLSGRESEILRAAIGYSLGMLAFICLWTFWLAQLLPG